MADPFWQLYFETIACSGTGPTLIEWDNDVPDWPILAATAARATALLELAAGPAVDLTAVLTLLPHGNAIIGLN